MECRNRNSGFGKASPSLSSLNRPEYLLHNQSPFFLLPASRPSKLNSTLLSKLVLVISSSLVLFLFHPAISLAHIAGKRAKRANATKLLIDRPPLKNAIGDGSHVCVAQVLVRGINGEAWRVHLTTRRCDKPAARQLPRIRLLEYTGSDLASHGQPRNDTLHPAWDWSMASDRARRRSGRKGRVHSSFRMLRPASSSFCFCLLLLFLPSSKQVTSLLCWRS